MRPLMLFLTLSLGSASLNLAAEVADPYAEAVALTAEGRVTEAILRMESLINEQDDSLALGYLGTLMECDGQDDWALETYLRLLASPFGGREVVSYQQLIERTGRRIGPFWPLYFEDARHLARSRLIYLGSRKGGEARKKVVEAIPSVSETEALHWRDAIAANHLIPDKREGKEPEQWFEFLKRQPKNLVALKLIIECDLVIDWDGFRAWVFQHGPDLPIGWEVALRLKGMQTKHLNDLQRWNDFADWLENQSIDDLKRVPSEVWRRAVWLCSLAPIYQSQIEGLTDFHEPTERVMNRLIPTTDHPFLQAEKRLALALGTWAFRGPNAPEIVEHANAATALLTGLATQRGPAEIVNQEYLMTTFTEPFMTLNNVIPILETVPQSIVLHWNSAFQFPEHLPVAPFIEQIESPVLRVMMSGERHSAPRLRYLANELDKARKKTTGPVLRDLRRCLWAEALVLRNTPLLEHYSHLAMEDLKEAATEADSVFALEALAHLVFEETRLSGNPDPFRPTPVLRNATYQRFVQVTESLIADSPKALHLVLTLVRSFSLEREKEWKHYFTADNGIHREYFDYRKQAQTARAATDSPEGLFDLVMNLRHADRQWAEKGSSTAPDAPTLDEGRALRILKKLHQRYPQREEWTVELAMRTPDEDEAYRLLDQVMAQGEIVFHAALWAAPSALAANHFGRPDLGEGGRPEADMGQRLARWEKLRRVQGSRRWMRESDLLFRNANEETALNLMLDGAGSAEHAYSWLREREFGVLGRQARKRILLRTSRRQRRALAR